MVYFNMVQQEIIKLQESWAMEEQGKLEEHTASGIIRRKRQYLHFDYKITTLNDKLLKQIFDPVLVAGHIFFPFIRDIREVRRFKRDTITKLRAFDKKPRPICYASHGDALIFSWYGYLLNYFYEKKIKEIGIENCPTAYRKHKIGEKTKTNTHYFKEVFDFIQQQPECAVVLFDVKSFFDSLDHKLIKKSWTSLLPKTLLNEWGSLPSDHFTVYKNITKYHFVDKKLLFLQLRISKAKMKKISVVCTQKEFNEVLKPSGLLKLNLEKTKGIPQGAAISSVLSNAYMIDFDVSLRELVNKFGGLYRRYSDDIIVVCPIKNVDIVKEHVRNQIEKSKLTIQETKTETRVLTRKDGGKFLCTNEDGDISNLVYLGLETDGNNIFLKSGTLSRFYSKMSWEIQRAIKIAKKYNFRIIRKRKLYEKFTTLGKFNFLTYAKKASVALTAEKTIGRQVRERQIFKNLANKIFVRVNKEMTKSTAKPPSVKQQD